MNVWWRWMRDALSPTPEEVQRVVDPGPPGWREGTAAATTPTAGEVQRLARPVSHEVLGACREATVPTEHEINRLLVGLRETERRRATGPGWRGLAWGRPLALAGAALAVATVALLPGPAEPELALVDASAWTAGQPVVLNAAITVDGSAEVLVTRTDGAGTRVDLQDGAAWFDVDPLGDADLRELLVVAGPVKVRVQGTRFQVRRELQTVSVEVARGKVEVLHGDERRLLTAGQSWQLQPEVGEGPLAQVRELVEEVLPVREAPQVRLPQAPEERVSPPASRSLDEIVPDLAVEDAPGAGEAEELDPALAALELALEASTGDYVVDGMDPAKDQWAVIQKAVRAGDSQVLSALDSFLAKHGDSVYGEAARVERLRLLVERRPAVEALAELDRWLETYPSSARQVQVHNLRAGVTLGQLQDCDAARTSLEVVSARGAGSDAATASASLGACALEAGEPDLAVAALERALTQDLPPGMQSQVKDDLREARRRQRR